MSSNAEGCYHISFKGHAITKSSGIKPHVVYSIRVSDPMGEEWTVQKRYSEMRILHLLMSKNRSGTDVSHAPPSFPRRRVLGNQRASFVASRQVMLQCYFDMLLRDQQGMLTPALRQFLHWEASQLVPGATCTVNVTNIGGDALQTELPISGCVSDVKAEVERQWGVPVKHQMMLDKVSEASSREVLTSLGTLGTVTLTMVHNLRVLSVQRCRRYAPTGADGDYFEGEENFESEAEATPYFVHKKGRYEFRFTEGQWILRRTPDPSSLYPRWCSTEIVRSTVVPLGTLPPDVGVWLTGAWDYSDDGSMTPGEPIQSGELVVVWS